MLATIRHPKEHKKHSLELKKKKNQIHEGVVTDIKIDNFNYLCFNFAFCING